VAPVLEAALDQSRRASERYMMTRCLEGLAEVALVQGDARRCRAFGDELLALAKPNGLRELEASARRWRGEALLAEQDNAAAMPNCRGGSPCRGHRPNAASVGYGDRAGSSVRRPGRTRRAERHQAKARAIAVAITASLGSFGLEARLRPTGDSG